MSTKLPTHAEVVIIGGGIIGCSTAYHLTKMGKKDVLLLERKQLTSGTTWHAAGLVRAMLYSANLTKLAKYTVELYSKLSFPWVNLIMVLVAIPFSLQAPRGGRLFGVALAIGIMAGYLVVHYVALAFARADLLPPLLAAWTANIIFLGLGTSLFLRART